MADGELVSAFESALLTQGSIGALERIQARFFAARAMLMNPATDREALQAGLLLLLANQRSGNTVANREGLTTFLQEQYPEALPRLESWLAVLSEEQGRLVAHSGSPSSPHALVLWGDSPNGRIWGFQRSWTSEERIAVRLRDWLNKAPTEVPGLPAILEAAERLGFPDGHPPHPQQRQAVLSALRHPFSIVSGGPGTGKTTVVRMILAAVCDSLHISTDRTIVCAPTGRAKARLQESLTHNLPPGSHLAHVEGRTLHSLLRYRSNGEPTYNPANPLPYDLVVVDEVSMVDSAQFANLVDALTADARLVIVGDMDQLPPVESGAVLGDLTQGLRKILGDRLTILTHNYRSDRRILDWWSKLRERRDRRVSEPDWNPLVPQEQWEHHVQDWLQEFQNRWMQFRMHLQADPEFRFSPLAAQEFRALTGSGRILCVTNQGPAGKETWNRRCRALMQDDRSSGSTDGEPLIVEQNQHVGNAVLYNGDLGIAWYVEGRRSGLFLSGGILEQIDLARIRNLSPAYAITVHKSQGSEFGTVFLALPDKENRMVSRQLVYTAVTRAQNELFITDPESLLQEPLTQERRVTWLSSYIAQP